MQEITNSRAEDGSAYTTKKMREAVALLEVALCHGSTGFAYIDRGFRYVRVNDQLAQMDGLPAEEHVGRPVWEVTGPEQWPIRKQLLTRALAGETVLGAELAGPLPHRPTFLRLTASYYPVWVEGEVAGAAVFFEDNTEEWAQGEALDISERRKSALLDAALDCIVTMDHAGRIIEFNRAAERTFGYTREEAVGQPVGELLVPPAGRARYYESFASYLKTGEGDLFGQRIETTAMRKDGSEFPVEIVVSTITLDDRPFFTAYLRDISDREQSARSLAERERQLRAIFESTLDAILIADDQMRYTDVNPASCALFGLPREELIGRRITDFVIASQRSPAESLWDSFQEAGRQTGEFVLSMPNGTERIVEYAATSDFLPGRHLSVLRDITDRKRAERELKMAHEASLAMVARQRAFLTDVLASVTEGKLRLCDNPDQLPEPLARIGEPVSLDHNGGLSLLRNAVRDAAQAQGYAQIRRDDLALATSEVATNAIKHGGGGTGSVHAAAGGPVQVWVADSGRGISMENLPKATLVRGYTTAGTMGHGMKIALQTIDRMWLLTGPTGTTIVLEQDPAPRQSLWE